MKNIIRFTHLFTFALLTVFVVGCASQPTQIDSTSDAKSFLSKSEVVAHVSGNTEKWSKGAGYYGEDGKIQGIWDGSDINGTWAINEDGRLCLAVTQFGGEDCHQYEIKDSKVQLVYEGKSTFREVKSGNQLDSFR